MSASSKDSISKLKKAISSIGTTSFSDSSQIALSLNSLDNSQYSVQSQVNLPGAADNIGRFVYVEDIKSFRFSDGIYWNKETCTQLGTYRRLFGWGNNSNSRLGNSSILARCSPGTVSGGGNNWCFVQGNANSSVGIKTDGTIWTWGSGCCGVLAEGTTTSRSSPGTISGGGTNWCRVFIGNLSTAAIKTDGTIWTWGNNATGRLGDGTTVLRCSPGTIWGSYTNWCQLDVTYTVSAIKCDGTLWTWGSSTCGSLGDGTTVSRCSPGTIWGGGITWCKVSNTLNGAMALKCDGTLWTWGQNNQGQLGDGTTVNRCSPGTVVGDDTNWRDISGGSTLMGAIKCDGTLWTWGSNSCGQLGDGTTTNRFSPGTIAGGGTNWCQISFGVSNVAIKTDGSIWTWGCGANGAMGNGTTVARCSPGTIIGINNNWCIASAAKVGTNPSVLAIQRRGF